MKTIARFRAYCGFLSTAAVACLMWAMLIPGEGGGAFFGMSAARFALAVFLFCAAIVFAGICLDFRNIGTWLHTQIARSTQRFDWLAASAFIGLMLGALTLVVYLLFPRFAWAALVLRFLPLTTLLFAYGLGYAIFSFQTEGKNFLSNSHSALIVFAACSAFFILLVGAARFFRLGLSVDPVYWMHGLPVPVFPAQFGLLFVAGLMAVWLFNKTLAGYCDRNMWLDIVICAAIWGIAFFIWSGYAVPNTYFSPKPLPPTYDVFPFSDARRTDLSAFSFLTGEMGLNQRIPVQPLYALFIAGLHLMAGTQYQAVINLQVAVLALLPVFLYLLGRKMHSRTSGIFIAILMILKETNTLSNASLLTTSNSKLYLTELPTALILSGLLFVTIDMFKNRAAPAWKWVLAGGLAGLACLTRLQTLLIMASLLVAIIVAHKMIPKWKRAALLLCSGFVLVVAPWLVRNFAITGTVVFEDPEYSSRSTAMVGLEISEKEARQNISDYSSAVGSSLQYMLKNPAAFLAQTANHFTHNELVSLYTLPVLAQPIDGVRTLLEPEKAYWAGQREPNPEKDAFALLAAILVIGIGAAVGFHTIGWPALLPLAAHFVYNLSSAIFRFSGWRYALPVDWVLLLYVALACAWVIQVVTSLYGKSGTKAEKESEGKKEKEHGLDNRVLLIGLLLLVLGLALPAASLLKPRYPKMDTQALMREIEEFPALPEREKQQIREIPVEEVYKGLALYPRYYEAGQGEPSSDVFYKARDYARLLFVYIGSDKLDVEFASVEIPEKIRHAREIIMGGRLDGKFFFADWILLLTDEPIVYFRDGV